MNRTTCQMLSIAIHKRINAQTPTRHQILLLLYYRARAHQYVLNCSLRRFMIFLILSLFTVTISPTYKHVIMSAGFKLSDDYFSCISADDIQYISTRTDYIFYHSYSFATYITDRIEFTHIFVRLKDV